MKARDGGFQGKGRRRRGVLLLDSMVSLAIGLAMLMAMTVTVAYQQKAEERLAARRAESRRVEAALLTLQSGGKPEQDARVERLGDAAPAGMVWTRVSFAGDPNGAVVGLVAAGQNGRQP